MDENKPEEETEETIEETLKEIEQPEESTEEVIEQVEEVEQPEEVVEEEVIETQPEVVESAPVKEELPKKFTEQPKQIGAPVPGRLDRLKSFILECKRVIRVTKKPDKQEFITIVKISAVGMAVVGIIGFAVSLVKELLL